MSDVDQKIEQAKILMNENVSGNIDPEELAMRLNISYSWFRRVFKGIYRLCTRQIFSGTETS